MKPNDFRSLNLSATLLKSIAELGYSEMTPVQASSIPAVLSGFDIVAQSKTGSGKTAAFVLPILHKISMSERKVQALILCPTRELSDQVLRESQKLARYLGPFQAVSLVGGQSASQQTQVLAEGAHLVVGTPGRTLELLRSGKLDVTKLKFLVLDEADRLLEESFAEEITAILAELPRPRQTLFFSATFPESIERLSRLHQRSAKRITVSTALQEVSAIQQFLYLAEKPEKLQTLLRILTAHPSVCTLIFCRTKMAVDEIGKVLANFKVSSRTLHADLPQSERDLTTTLFRNGSLRVLVATDVAARGLDIDALALVINFDLPSSSEIFIHRIGRTGRAGRTGTAVSIATAYESTLVLEIETATGVKMNRVSALTGEATVAELGQEFQQTLMKTIHIPSGRNQKLKPEDLLKILISGPEALMKAEIGKIEIQERNTYIAVTPQSCECALRLLQTNRYKLANVVLVCK